jgi:hypothetical protein
MIACPNCGCVIAGPATRRGHAILVSGATLRHRRGHKERWAAIASCNRAVIGCGPTFDAAVVDLDRQSDQLALRESVAG